MTLSYIIEILREIVRNPKTLIGARFSEKFFTRNRKMGFPDCLNFLLDMRKAALQNRLNQFFKSMGRGRIMMSEQALSKARNHFDHSPFVKMVREVVAKEYSGKFPLPTWNGLHVLADDGTYLLLPKTKELKEVFGTRGEKDDCVSAGASVLYDVLHGWVLDPSITNANMNEREECKKHIDFLCGELPHIAEKSIILLDRGYPSLDMIQKIQESGVKFLARCNSQFLSEINNAPLGDSVATLKNGVSVRVIKFKLPSGEIEVLISNLFDLPESLFPELYSLRWGIEVAYFRLKQELCVEKFSGKTGNSIRQDFWAAMVLLNAVAVVQKEADAAVQERQKSKSVKHQNRARTSGVIVTLRDRFIFAVLSGKKRFMSLEMKRVIKAMAREVSPVRPGRSYPRNFKQNYFANHNLKSHL